jgi:hypothetical protein
MPPKKVGYSARRSTTMSSLSRRRQPHMKGYKEGVRMMDKSSKIALGVLFGKPSYNTQKRISKTSNLYSVNTNFTYEGRDNIHSKQIWAFILITLETILFTTIFVAFFHELFIVSILTLFLFCVILPIMFLSVDINIV